MGPLCFCSNCYNQLSIEWAMFNQLRLKKLQEVDLNQLNDFDQEQLLDNTSGKLLSDLGLRLCCLTIISHSVDLTPQICN
jgi:DNA-directed RNA polymerase subunit N (RpoN/RPB10)